MSCLILPSMTSWSKRTICLNFVILFNMVLVLDQPLGPTLALPEELPPAMLELLADVGKFVLGRMSISDGRNLIRKDARVIKNVAGRDTVEVAG